MCTQLELRLAFYILLVLGVGAHDLVPERPVQTIVANVARVVKRVRVHPPREGHELQRAKRKLVAAVIVARVPTVCACAR